MATPVKDVGNTRKHLTNTERAAREAAQQQMERRFVRLVAPPAVIADTVAYKHWQDTIARMKGITLLDNVDIDMLSVYCLGLSRLAQLRADATDAKGKSEHVLKRTLEKFLAGEYSDEDYPAKVIRACITNEADVIKLIQAQERIVLAYAEKLGLTPAGRVRLAKKRAEEKPATEADDLYG
jgi:phage terminase small subunit